MAQLNLNLPPSPTSAQLNTSSTADSPYVYANQSNSTLAISSEQHSSPLNIARNSSRRRTLERMGPSASSSNISLQLNMQNFQQNTSDIYEFQSSPEDTIAQIASGSNTYFTTVLCANSSTSSTMLQQKSSSVSSLPSILATVATTSTSNNNVSSNTAIVVAAASPPKRIKTAFLAKKLLAAAVDSNIIDPSTLAISPQNKQRNNTQRNEEEEQQQQSKHKEIETDCIRKKLDTIEDEHEEEEQQENDERSTEEVNVDFCSSSDNALQRHDQKRAYSFTCSVDDFQEQKKVPPLRISLVKTPSEEGVGDGAVMSSSPISLGSRKGKGTGCITGSGIGTNRIGTRRNTSRKEDIQRITRSRVRQNVNTNDVEDNAGDGPPSRKRRHRAGITAFGISDSGSLKGEDTRSTIMDGLAGDKIITSTQNLIDDDDGTRSEDLQSNTTNAVSGSQSDSNVKEKAQEQQVSIIAQLLARNSFEQTIAFDAMIRDKWIRQYKQHLVYILEKVESITLHEQLLSNKDNNNEEIKNKPKKNWPETLEKLFAKQEKRRQELIEEHCLDRDRIEAMAQTEYCRLMEHEAQLRKTNAHYDDNSSSEQKQTIDREGHPFSFISFLRDSKCCNPVFMANTIHNSPVVVNRTLTTSQKKTQQRFLYLANTTKNRHTMEAHALFENQIAEWNRTARRSLRETEQQQLMMKGPIGKQQQSQLAQLVYPENLWVDIAVTVVPVIDIKFPKFIN